MMKWVHRFRNEKKFNRVESHGRYILDEFKKLMGKEYSLSLVNFFDERSKKELQYLLLKCTTKGVHESPRAISFLTSEINRRVQNKIIYISVSALFVSALALIKSFL